MRRWIFLSVIVIVLNQLAVSLASAQPAVFAYYYPWYVKGDWSRHKYVGTPVLGKYGTDSPKIAERHVQWCAEYGIDGFFVSWWGKDHLAARHLSSGLMKAKNLSKIRFALFYESLGLLDHCDGSKDGVIDFSNRNVMDALIAEFRHLKKSYFTHPQYLKIGKRPVVGLYVTRTFKGLTRDHLHRLRKTIGMDLYLIGDEAYFGEQSSPKTARNGSLFDATTAYNMFENARVRKHDTALTYQAREALPIFRKWAAHTTFVPGIFPSYSDFRGNKRLGGSANDFAALLDAAANISRKGRGKSPPMILVTSFNEWWEGTTIEPAREYGRGYLDVIRALGRK